VASGQLGLTGGAQPMIFFPNPRNTSIQLLLEAQQHKKYAQTTLLDDGVSSLLIYELFIRIDFAVFNQFKSLNLFLKYLEMKYEISFN
jgi:hypothetical protein